jgi:hypothetical protein
MRRPHYASLVLRGASRRDFWVGSGVEMRVAGRFK